MFLISLNFSWVLIFLKHLSILSLLECYIIFLPSLKCWVSLQQYFKYKHLRMCCYRCLASGILFCLVGNVMVSWEFLIFVGIYCLCAEGWFSSYPSSTSKQSTYLLWTNGYLVTSAQYNAQMPVLSLIQTQRMLWVHIWSKSSISIPLRRHLGDIQKEVVSPYKLSAGAGIYSLFFGFQSYKTWWHPDLAA